MTPEPDPRPGPQPDTQTDTEPGAPPATAQPDTLPATTRSGRAGWLATGVVLAVLTLAAGTLSAANWLTRHTETQHRAYQRPATQLVLDTDSADVTVTPSADGTVDVNRRVTWTLRRPTIDESWDGQALRARLHCPRISGVGGPGCGIDYRIAVPTGITVTVHTKSGDVNVRGLTGEVRVNATSGDVHGADLRSSTVDTETTSGDVRLDFVSAPRESTSVTTSGDVSISVPESTAYQMETSSESGDASVTVPQNPSSIHRITVRTSSGDIRVGPPRHHYKDH